MKSIKNRIYYFINGMISIEDFDPKLSKKLIRNHKKILIFITLDI